MRKLSSHERFQQKLSAHSKVRELWKKWEGQNEAIERRIKRYSGPCKTVYNSSDKKSKLPANLQKYVT